MGTKKSKINWLKWSVCIALLTPLINIACTATYDYFSKVNELNSIRGAIAIEIKINTLPFEPIEKLGLKLSQGTVSDENLRFNHVLIEAAKVQSNDVYMNYIGRLSALAPEQVENIVSFYTAQKVFVNYVSDYSRTHKTVQQQAEFDSGLVDTYQLLKDMSDILKK